MEESPIAAKEAALKEKEEKLAATKNPILKKRIKKDVERLAKELEELKKAAE